MPTVPVSAIGICLAGLALSLAGCAGPHASRSWSEAQDTKHRLVGMAARHAMEQQRTSCAEPLPLALPRADCAVSAQPVTTREPGPAFATIELDAPIDMVGRHSGLAFTVRTADGTSPEVRLGCRLFDSDGGQVEITPMLPVLSPWGDNPHEIYFDWSFLNYRDADQAVAVLKNVNRIELTAGAIKRAPQRGPADAARPASFTVTDLRLVDYLHGSYDPSRQWLRFDEEQQKWVPGERRDLTLQHRCQEVTGLVSLYGGEPGVRSAIDALDMAVRTQCWDGSFLDGRRGARTVASGEYTFGFTIYGTISGYIALEQMRHPALDEKMTVGPATMTRREFYRRMFYRAAMARTAAGTIADYRDDIIGGNTLITGANRVLGYAIGMRMVADVLEEGERKERVLEHYRNIMQEIVAAQGQFSGGFPLLGEGNRYSGKGIHYDSGYVRTHMDWLIIGVRRTADPLLVRMLRRYQTVIEAVMDEKGTGLLPLISERHQGTEPVRLVLPDATAQVGLKHGLPVLAQWGYNVGMPVWRSWGSESGNHFSYGSHVRGYRLGAHIGRLVEDMQVEPEPRDLGYLFPRQYPVWSARLHTKDGVLVRTSNIRIQPDGTTTSDFKIEVGEYPVTVGVPVRIKSPQGVVRAVADGLSGWPKLLPERAPIEIAGGLQGKGRLGESLQFTLQGETKVIVTGPAVTLPPEAGARTVPFRAELTLTPERAGLPIELTVLRGNQ